MQVGLVFGWKKFAEQEAELKRKDIHLGYPVKSPGLQRYRVIFTSFQKENKIFKQCLPLAFRVE